MERALAAAMEAAIRATHGNAFRLASVQSVSGGDIDAAWVLTGTTKRYFVKTAAVDAAHRFAAEADGLAALAARGAIRVPAVVAQDVGDGAAFLVLEYLDLHPLTREHGARFGEALAALHAPGTAPFGWHRDNFLGRTPQSNRPARDWGCFFAQERLAPLLAQLAARGYGGDLQAHGARIVDKIGAFFLDHPPAPSLLHGDLWSGNAAMLAEGEPVIFDPACYHGDREADLAMTELFGGFPESFYAAYRQAAPLAEGYEQRKTLYNLYHILNHLLLFGRGYLRQAERMAQQLFEHLRR